MPQPFPFEYELGPTGIYPQALTPWKTEGPSRAVFTHQRHARLDQGRRAGFVSMLGAFPVHRGSADREALRAELEHIAGLNLIVIGTLMSAALLSVARHRLSAVDWAFGVAALLFLSLPRVFDQLSLPTEGIGIQACARPLGLRAWRSRREPAARLHRSGT